MCNLSDKSIDIAAICETWLTDANCPTTAIIKSYGYRIIHNFRKDKKGGGTALLFRGEYSMSQFRCSATFSTFEYTAASIKTATGTKVMFVSLYRPGYLSSIFHQELDVLLSAITMKCDCLVIAGDLNIHFENKSDKLVRKTLDLFLSYGFNHHVNEPTHVAGGSLDQIFCFSIKNQLQCKVLVDSVNRHGSDHFPVYCDFSLEFEKKYFKDITYRNLKTVDNDKFTSHLFDVVNLIDFGEIGTTDMSASVTDLNDLCAELLDEHAPIVSKKVSVIDSAPWFDNEYRDYRKLRRKAEAKTRKPTATLEDKIMFKDISLECTKMADLKKKEYFKNMVENSKGNPRTLWQLVNRNLDRKQSNPLPDYTDDLPKLAADFNTYFTSKIDNIRKDMDHDRFTLPSDSSAEAPESYHLSTFEPATLDELKEIIDEFGIKCSPSDILPTTLLKENISILLPLLLQIVNASLSQGSMDGVKLADIVPLLKSNSLDPNVLKNFRPVSNLTFLGKLIERVVLKRLNDHLDNHNLHCPEQSAYKKTFSTETLLIRIWNDLLVASDEKSATVVMMLDLSAAFDTVDHDLLLNILMKEIGLRGTVLKWFTSFLKGRAQRIRLGSTLSEEIVIKFGVPQGSVLGPVLFNLYIRSIYRFVQGLDFTIYGYADDHQILKRFKPINQCETLLSKLRGCFESIRAWMRKYFLAMNDSKTQIIVFGPMSVLREINIKGVNFGSDTTVRFVSTVKNLGIHMDSGLTMSNHVVELKKKCFLTLRNLTKIRFLLTTKQLKTIVNSLVVSCLDYCNAMFYGISKYLIHQLQLIQNACAKAVTGKYKFDHLGDDLDKLHWLNIPKRVIFKICLLSFKAINGIAPLYLQDMFKYAHHGHTVRLIVPYRSTKGFGDRSFSVVGPRVFNALPDSVKQCYSVEAFKSALKTYLFTLSDTEVAKMFY